MGEPVTTILVCGGRDFTDAVAVGRALGRYDSANPPRLVHGDARGADRIAADIATDCQWQVVAYPADWERLGPAAGPIRNRAMIEQEHPDVVLAFPGGRGTADMVRKAEAAGIPVERVGW